MTHVELTSRPKDYVAGAAIRTAWKDLLAMSGRVRARDAAKQLGVSEGELIASSVGDGAIRLRTEGAGIIQDIPALGPVMALTRNEHCVHEKIGPYRDVTIGPAVGLVLGKEIDLRLFPSQWRHSFALIEETEQGPRRSLQMFDAAGMAIHKIYQKPETDIAAFDALIERWRHEDQTPHLVAEEAVPAPIDRADTEIDVECLRADWSAMKDTHEFFGLLKRLAVGRLQSFRLAGPTFARLVPASALAQVLEGARDRETPIMVFTGNGGCIQIHTGPVANLKRTGPWFNVLDADFNLHLREDAIASAWVVRKPTQDGDVTSLELFDQSGFCFAQLFGARKPGKPELEAWRALLSEVGAA